MLRRAAHLAGRLVRSLWPFGPSPADRKWVAEVLLPAEHEVWARMSRSDRRESVRVGRRVEARLSGTPHGGDGRWLAAALLHDVGKIDAALGPWRRALATMAGGLAGHDMAEAWTTRGGITRRFGLYLRHPQVGADRLRLAGAREEAAAWAGAHHDPGSWGALPVPRAVCEALAAADGEPARPAG